MKWVMDVLRPFATSHPDTPMIELAELLPEPQRSRALDICYEVEGRTPWEKLPFQRVGRRDYHLVVEKALSEVFAAHKDFTLPNLLDGVGLLKNSPDRAQGEAYAKKLLLASGAFEES